MEKWLEKLLGKELFDQVIGKLGDNKKHLLYQEKDGDFVPRSRIDEEKAKAEPLQAKITKLEADLTAATEKVTTLEKEKNAGNQTTDDKIATLTKQIEDLTKLGEEKDKKLNLEKKVGVLKNQLVEAKVNPKYMDDVIRRFEKEGSLDHLEVENGKIKGFEDLHKPIFENNPEMYGEFNISGGQPGGGSGDRNLGETETMTKYKTLMAKKPEELTAAQNLELGELAIKVKDEQNSKNNKE